MLGLAVLEDVSFYPRYLVGLTVAACFASLLSGSGLAGQDTGASYEPYRADLQKAVPAGLRPARIQVLSPAGEPGWDGPPQQEMADRIRQEWTGRIPYGAVRAGVPVWLRYPLVTHSERGGVQVPVVDGDELPILGRVSLPGASGPRRVVILVDASLSANARIRFDPVRGMERITVLEAERRALEHIVRRIEADPGDEAAIEVGVIAFGETTWPIAEPGLPRDELRAALDRFRVEVPRGAGRTDLVCALWLAREWLEAAPRGYARELVLLTDGDLPHSGRFLNCKSRKRHYGDHAYERCEAERNVSVCPAQHEFRRSHGKTDWKQLAFFTRKSRKAIQAFPLIFEVDRGARPYQKLADRTGGELIRISSPHSLEAALPALVIRDIQSVTATNQRTRETTGNILDAATQSFDGRLPLLPGANDVELRIEGRRGLAGLFRFRSYSAPDHLERFLADLRESNQELERRSEALIEEIRSERPPGVQRSLDVYVDDSAAGKPGDG